VSLLKAGSDFEPITPPRTAWAAGVYAALAAVLLILAVLLMSSTAYRENAGVTLEEARLRTRAVLPVVAALAGSSLALGVAAWLCWRERRWAIPFGVLLVVAAVIATAMIPLSLRGYGGFVVLMQLVALGWYAWLRRPRAEPLRL
jgi:hypothetical protein